MKKPALIALFATPLLAGCVTTQDAQRAVLGAIIGCAVGEIIEDGKCITGAAVGAAGGALADDVGVVQ